MANVEHSTLTGTDLHELKGVAAATNDTVATASAGATVWQKITSAHMDGSANIFGGRLLHVQELAASGVGTSSLTNNAWSTRNLTTEVTDTGAIGSVASLQITLAAGTYFTLCSASCYGLISGGTNPLMKAKLRLRNITDGSTLLVGNGYRFSLNGYSGTLEVNDVLTMSGVFTIAGSKLIELQQYSGGSGNGGPSITVSGGFPVASGENEIYADVVIWKLS